ncbi:MAG: tRNA (guanosine(37)-N1)-methyltransferase TrmD [Oscillospiraceae bacterium]
MRIDIATLFPEMFDPVLNQSIVGRGVKNGYIDIRTHDIRLYTENKHKRVDDKPYGGGTGMLMQAQPIYDCVMAIKSQMNVKPRILYMSPQGEVLTQKKVGELAAEPWLILLCGHYEGVDQRVLDELECEEISVGDYVLTGGELPAMILCDAVARLQPGVLPNEDAYSIESHFNGLLEFPQYTRPEEWRGRRVPEELLTGDHKTVTEWQLHEAYRVTATKRPDMYNEYANARLEDFWKDFLEAKGLDKDTEYYKVQRMGQDEKASQRLIKLTMRGKKRATISACNIRGRDGGVLPKKGAYTVIADWYGIPCCVIKTVRAQMIRFNEITIEQVLKMGEDTTIEDWLERHRDFFKKTGADFSEDMPIVYEEFRLEYKGTK